nr:hypothetical protein [Gammaproteobacteria bacterium]
MRLFQQLATKEIQPYTTHAVKRMEHFSQTGILKGFARKQIKTHIMPVQSISENNLNSALTLESMHRLTRDFLNGDAISKLGSFNKFVSHLDGHLELLEDLNLQKIFGYIIHRYTLLEPAPSFLNTTEIQPTLLYHPHLWALDKDEVGTGLLPYLFMRFSYKLQLEHPTTPCYGLLPTSTPWVAMMLNNRFPEHFPSLNYSEEALKETDNRPQLKPHGIKIMQAALKRFYAISEQGPEPMKDCDLFHPRYSVKDSWFTGGFSDKARVIGNIGPAINIHTNFKKKIEENSSREEEEKEKPKDKESDKKNIFLTILPCNQTNLIHFVETINMLRQFGMQSLLSNTRATEQKESSFITDLFAILRLSEEQQARVGNPSKLCDLYSRFYNTQERPLHNAIIVNEQK